MNLKEKYLFIKKKSKVDYQISKQFGIKYGLTDYRNLLEDNIKVFARTGVVKSQLFSEKKVKLGKNIFMLTMS